MAANKLPDDALLDDLCTRFILNVPAEELTSFEKLMFLVEQAHWFYLDFCRDRDTSLRSLGLKEFTALLFRRCPGLSPYAHMCSDILGRFAAFKQGVPVMGAVLLDPSLRKCLLVKGYAAHSAWGFPRGKVAKGEADASCAIREVREETGFDIAARLVPEDCIEMHIKEQRTKLFIITNVDESTPFAPLVRGEIGGYAWHMVADLPATKEASLLTFHTADGTRLRFHNVWPYMKQLRHWIKRRRRTHPAAASTAAKQTGHPTPKHAKPAQAGTAAASAVLGHGAATGEHAAQMSGELESTASSPVQQPLGDQPDAAAPLRPTPARTAHVASTTQLPGQAWLHFRLDSEAVMHALNLALGQGPAQLAH